MKRFFYLIVTVILLSLLPACGSAQPQQAAPPEQQEEAQAETAQESTEEEPAEVQPAISKEEAMKKWGVPFLSSAFASTLCKRIVVKPEESSPLAVTIALGLSAEMLKEWKPTPDQSEVEQSLKGAIKTLGDTFTDNSGKPELSSAVGEICPSFETIMNDMRVKARADGVADDDFMAMIEEMQKKLESK